MKIITLSSKDTFGGAAKVAYRLYRSSLSQGINNTLIVNSKRSDDDSVITASSLHGKKSYLYYKIYNFLLRRQEKSRIKKWDRYLSTREDKVYMDLEISLLRNALDNVDFDLLHMHWVGESFVNFTEFKNITTPVVWTLHDCFAFTGICTYFEDCYKFETHCGNCPQLHSEIERDYSYEIFEQKKDRYNNIDFHIVCPSYWLAREASKSHLLSRYPIIVIPNGIDTQFFSPKDKSKAKISLNINPEKLVILFGGISIGRDTRKGGHLLVEALSHLRKIFKDAENIELLILGVNSSDIDFNFKATFLGYVDDESIMLKAYSAADVTVVPSMYENLPTVIMESMACGTPVAAFDIGGNSDMIVHRENGYLSKPYDVKDLAEGIKYCLENNEESILGKNARKKILTNFRIEDVTQRYIDLYKKILDKERNENTV